MDDCTERRVRFKMFFNYSIYIKSLLIEGVTGCRPRWVEGPASGPCSSSGPWADTDDVTPFPRVPLPADFVVNPYTRNETKRGTTHEFEY